MRELEILRESIRELVMAMRDLLLAGTAASERVAIHHAKQILERYKDIK